MAAGGDRGGAGDPPPLLERLGASAPYLLPLLDGLVFGRFVFERAPALAALVVPAVAPLFRLYRGTPFFAFGIFFALYVLVVRNTGFSRFVRFNTQQALLIDVVLILPQLLGGAVAAAGVPGWILEAGSSTIFYAVVASVVYAVVSNLRGDTPDQIPGVSEAVEAQIGTFCFFGGAVGGREGTRGRKGTWGRGVGNDMCILRPSPGDGAFVTGGNGGGRAGRVGVLGVARSPCMRPSYGLEVGESVDCSGLQRG